MRTFLAHADCSSCPSIDDYVRYLSFSFTLSLCTFHVSFHFVIYDPRTLTFEMLALGIKGISTIRVPTLRAVNCYQRLLDTSRYFSSETGSVKFYLRRKAYGFITRDTTGDDIFVHRTEISGATSDDPFNPELRAGERVKFTLKDINGKTFATQVTMEDGSLVPKTRDDFSSKRVRSIKTRLGHQVYDILTEGGDEEVIASKISDAYIRACSDIEAAEKMTSFEDYSDDRMNR